MVLVSGLLRAKLRLVLSITLITIGLSLVSSHARAVSGLVAAYNFDEGTGTTVADASGNGNTGTVSNTTWSTTGKYGKALTFNGTNSWVTVPNSTSLHLTTGMTLEAWVNPTSSQSGVWQSVIMKEHTGDLDYALYKANSTGKPEGVVYTTAEHELPGTSNLALNTWAHLSETYDGTTMRLYVNGVQVASKAQTGSINVSTGALRIGGDSIWGEYFKGMIDDVRIYNRALSATEIQTDMNTPVGSVADTTPPTAPSSLHQTGSTMTSATLGWTASTDNVGVTGYDVYLNSLPVSTTVTTTSYNFTGLACGQTYPVAVDAYDAAGNHSTQTSSTITTAACDTTPPTVPTNLTQTGSTATSASVSWTASTDNVGVVGYGLYNNGSLVSSTSSTSATFNGLACGQTYPIAVDAYDAAGNRSAQATLSVTTAICNDTTPPTQPTGLNQTGSTTTSVAVSWTASTDNVGVAGYGLYNNSLSTGTTTNTSATFSGLVCGTTYTIGVDAFDAAGNHSTAATISATTSTCPDTTAPTVSMTAPINGATVNGSAVTVSANASDNVAVANVQFKLDGNNLGVPITTAPYSTVWDTTGVSNGIHTLTAVATDTSNNSTTATSITVTVNNPDTTPPTVSLTAPTNNATVSGTTTISANASDNVGVANVQFQLDGANLGATDTTSPYSLSWDTTGVSNGTHVLTAIATDTSNNTTTSGSVTVTVSNGAGQVTLNPASFNAKVAVGKGFVEASARQVIRTSNDVVYVITSDDSAQGSGIHAWKGSPAGIPTSFTEVDAAHHPTPTGETLGSPDMRLDNNNVVQLAYSNPANHNLYYRSFNTNTDTWSSSSISLATNANTGEDFTGGAARTGNVALILDGNDQPNIAYTTTTGSVLFLPSNGSGGFGAAQTIASGLSKPIHPALAMDGTGAIDITWVDNACTPGDSCNSTNNPVSNVKYAQRTPAGTWQTPEVVATGANAVNDNVYLDQGPNIVTNSSNVPYVEYVDAGTASGEIGDNLEIRYRTAPNTWANDNPPVSSYGFTHTPSIYSQGNDIYAVLGHDQNIHYGFLYQLGGAGNSWSPFQLLDSTQNDGSASVRWDPFRETDNRVIDTLYMNEVTPEVYYMALQPRGTGTGGDTTPPTATISSQPASLTNSTSASFSFSGSDNVTPANQLTFQCSLDGAAFSSCSSPQAYSGLAAGSHTFQVKATDQAGNVSAPASYTWTIDTSAPTAPTNLTATAVSASQINLTWTAATDDTGVTNYQITRNGSVIATVGNVTSYNNTGLSPSTLYTYSVLAIDGAGNQGAASGQASATTQSSSDTTPPTVSMSAPANNATVSGTSVTVSANASDNVGVVGVQFKLDGANLSAEDTTSPYSITWNSTTATNGTHTLTAVARDAAGNTTTATSVSVTVNNTSSGQFLVGDQTLEATSDSNSGGTAEAFRIAATTTGTLNSLVAYISSATTSSSVMVGLYANNGTHPGALLTSGTITNPTKNAWNTVTVSPVSVTSGTTYWIAILAPNGSGTVGFRDKASGGGSETDSVLNLLTLPANWTTGSTFTDGPLSAYGQN
jgi:chitodextrinase